jgi:copper homeostasis protein
MSTEILEVIACSVADAIQAQQGGAGRLEVVSDLDRGGLTPSITLVRRCRAGFRAVSNFEQSPRTR